MNKAIIGKKIGMSQIFTTDGKVIPVTVVEAGPCPIVQKKTVANDGYDAVQVAFGEVKATKVTKPVAGHFKKANVEPKRYLRELKFADCSAYEVGQTITCDSFAEGDKVDVDGIVYNYDGTVQLYIISIKEHDSSTVGLDAADLTGVTVCSAEGGTLYIVAEAGQSIQIWSVTGQLLYSDVARADLTAVSSMPCGVVIVRVGNETVKAIVR